MFFYLCGRLEDILEKFVVIDISGVGFRVFVDVRTSRRLPALGEEVKLYIYTHIREDALELYGFLELAELELFEALLGVSGVGPKVAHSILSSMSVDDFRVAIGSEDLGALTSISGVGKKTAQRLILELKDRIGLDSSLAKVDVGAFQDPKESDAIAALISLGYSRSEALRAVSNGKKQLKAEGKDFDLSHLIEYALKSSK